ncbi:MAG: hypothetical protein EOO44_22755, partial [Flavobacterium sp.]
MNVYLIRIFNRADTFIGKYRLHFISWIVYIVYESVLTGIFVQQFGEFENYIVHYSLNISLFYCHIYAMRKINFNFQLFDFLRFIPVVVLEILFYIPVLALLNRMFTKYNQPSDGLYLGINHLFIAGSIYRSIFFIMVSTGYWFILRFFSERKKLEILAKKHLNEVIVRERAEKNLALSKTDIVILVGGVSVGDYDYVIDATKKCGIEKQFHKIRQKPGKPFYFGTKAEK